MTNYVFSRVPGFTTWTGDKRVHANQRRTEFVAFVINLDTMKGSGFRSPSLPAVKEAVDHFTKNFKWPDGTTA